MNDGNIKDGPKQACRTLGMMIGKGWAFICIYTITMRALIWAWDSATANHLDWREWFAMGTPGGLLGIVLLHIGTILITAMTGFWHTMSE